MPFQKVIYCKRKEKNFQASLYTNNDNQADENKNLRPNEGAK